MLLEKSLTLLLLGSASLLPKTTLTTQMKEVVQKTMDDKSCIIGRVTYYHKYQGRWGNKVAMDTDLRAIEGITAAAHPKFPFGTKIYIPDLKDEIGDGLFVVQDRGTAVTKKKASRGRTYVFDIYIEAKTRREADKKLNELMSTKPDYMPVYLLKEDS